jgi:hypothetical protein
MIGLLPRVLLQMVEEEGGTEALGQVREVAELPEDFVFRMNEPYSDFHWRTLLGTAINVLEKTPIEMEHLFAKAFFSFTYERFRSWYDMCKNAREFLELQPRIHNSFATALREPAARRAVSEKFRLDTGPNHIVVHYASPNRMCGYYVAMAQLVIRHYGDVATIQQTRCMKQGDKECEIVVHWFEEDD